MQWISFCNSCILPVSSRIVSWSSIKNILVIVSKVELWNFFNSYISLRLFSWTSRRSQFCFNDCSWRSWWSCRRRFSAWARWSSSCCDSIVSLNFCILLRSWSALNSCFLISAWQSSRICSLCRSRRVLICQFSELCLWISWPCAWPASRQTTGCSVLSWLIDDDDRQDDRPSPSEWSARLWHALRSVWPMVISSWSKSSRTPGWTRHKPLWWSGRWAHNLTQLLSGNARGCSPRHQGRGRWKAVGSAGR